MGGRTFCSQRMLSQPLLSISTHLSRMHVDKSLSFTHFLVISQLWLNIHIFPQSTSNFATGGRKRSGTTITSSGSAQFGCTPVTVFRVGRSEIGKFKRTFGQLVPILANLEENYSHGMINMGRFDSPKSMVPIFPFIFPWKGKNGIPVSVRNLTHGPLMMMVIVVQTF